MFVEGGLKDFERSNVEFFEFWVLDPFIENPNLDINLFGGGNDLQNLLTKFLTKK
jgi:hypothetical protein